MVQDMKHFVNGQLMNPEQLFFHLSQERQEHSASVADLTIKMLQYAYENGFFEPDEDYSLEEIKTAIMYHDIGFVLIPERIQKKSEALTSLEYKVLYQHSIYGAKILENWYKETKINKKLWNLAAEICLTHHEQWNGKGYPYGLRATGIPVYARAVSVADTFDSIIRGSSYRMALPMEYAMVEITVCAGKQFDSVFSKILVEVLNV